ncbi:SDR family NAD(P)-dependent oxidoreductase [Catenulispora rubra]|uniref:SDR family NAD(P)-dependent oxidoreductase n=1 Tax=Catenulispora rubra TaxID=280293 RepID=UPI0018927874|nr:SDR family NAD(P)-dependent oxidoreductase [Catenulispora rubra]
MPQQILIVGGTSGIGRELAATYAERGASVVIAGRQAERARKVAAEMNAVSKDGGAVRGIAVDLSEPEGVVDALHDIEQVDSVVLTGMQRDRNTLAEYNPAGAKELAVVKVVGYTMVLHALRTRFSPSGSALLFGGIAKHAPYPGSTTVTAVNAAIVGMVTTLSRELAPIRVNAIHPGVVSDSPYWIGNESAIEAVRASHESDEPGASPVYSA